MTDKAAATELLLAEQACRRIVLKLQLIDDSPTSRRGFAEVPSGSASHESSIPKGVRHDLTGDHAPSKQFSLYAHYLWRMKRAQAAQDAGELLKLAGCATRDYEVYAHLRPSYHASHDAAVNELLRACRGQSAVEASWWVGAPVKWVRRQRVVNGYDAETGDPRPRGNATTERVFALRENGATVRVIAEEVGISTGQVSNILNGRTSSHVVA